MFYSFRLNFQLHRYRRANGQRYFFLSRARFLVFFFLLNRPRLSHVMATWHETSSFPVSKRLSHTSVKACLVMAGRYLALVLLFWGSFSVMVNGKCPCEDESLCEPIARPPGKEFLMFSTKPYVWKKYDWTKVTTIALFRPWDDELMCEAHKRVRNQLISLSIILLTLFAGLLLCKSTKSVLSKLERNFVIFSLGTRDDNFWLHFFGIYGKKYYCFVLTVKTSDASGKDWMLLLRIILSFLVILKPFDVVVELTHR